jgi:hypothetical protein
VGFGVFDLCRGWWVGEMRREVKGRGGEKKVGRERGRE